MRLELKIHNESRALPSVEGFVRGTLQQFALADAEVPRLERLVLHAVQHAVDHAYPVGELGVIELTLCEAEGRAEITVRDYGLPEDVRRLEAQLAKPSAAGIADHEAAELIDEMHWVSFGPHGKSLQLIKWLHTPTVTDASAETELASVAEDAPVAAEQEYSYRRMNREDALQVSQLIYRTYGGTYFNEDVYYPDRIAAANQEDRVLSVVAISQDGEVAGHCAWSEISLVPLQRLGKPSSIRGTEDVDY